MAACPEDPLLSPSLSGAMDSNDSFSLAMDSAEMPGYNGLAGGHHGHGPLGAGHPHHGPPGLAPGPGHYPEHYDHPGPVLPPHPVFTNCGKSVMLKRDALFIIQMFRWIG